MPKRYLPAKVDSGIYHVFSRGVEKRPIFLDDRDGARFFRKMNKYAEEGGVEILEHALMGNHFHMLLKAESPAKISLFLHRLCTSYAKYFNIKYDRVGPLFQSRFKMKTIDSDTYLGVVAKYIRDNPRNAREMAFPS